MIGVAGLIVLRLASIVPDGTNWAREFRAMSREVEAATAGAVKVKWTLGGIAGDEQMVLDRIRRDQLDGMVSGGMICERLAPSIRVMRIPGVFQSWNETSYVMGRLKPTLDKEFRQNGFANLGFAGVGPAILFSRTPIHSLDELRKARVWIWDIDEVLLKYLPGIGLKLVPAPIAEAGRMYDGGQHDGFITPASAALGFQWSAQVRYFAELRVNFLSGCLVIANRSMDALPVETQKIIRVAAAKASARLEDIGRVQDQQLLGGLFTRQGLTQVAVSDSFRAAFFDAARAARERVGDDFVPRELVQRVLGMLADHRAEHR